MIRKDIYQHFLVKIPNDRIFDQTRILERGEKACGSGVFDRLHGPKCISGFFSCHLQYVVFFFFFSFSGLPLLLVTILENRRTC